MPRSHALLVGLNSVDSATHAGWDGKNGCYGCELDVDNIAAILRQMGYSPSILKTAAATSTTVLHGLRSAAQVLKEGDIFVLYYAGHGGRQPDYNNDERDGHDETLVLYDRDVVDDELAEIWGFFRSGVRIVMISDSCNSGSNYRGLRSVSTEDALAIQAMQEQEISAQMIHYSGCRDGKTSAGYRTGGAFTIAFCSAWENGADNYPALHEGTKQLMKEQREPQQPQYSKYGVVDTSFENSSPFSVGYVAARLEEEIGLALRAMPVSWLHHPMSAKDDVQRAKEMRIAPLAAAAIGIAVGAGIQLGSQAMKNRQGPAASSAQLGSNCDLSVSEIEQAARRYVHETSEKEIAQLTRRHTGQRALPVAVVAFLAGVVAGSNAAKD